MQKNFHNAFYRHYQDADLLLQNGRWANADHLYGLCAECGLKAILIKQGVASDADHDIKDKTYKRHINTLWNEYLSFMQKGRVYLIPAVNPFDTWQVDQRYAHAGDVTEQTARNHGTAVKAIAKIINQAELDGVL
ncbi:hypothetical protein [Mailhella massiliensis]|uniref:hypothetical protein n=1 Tax=Mailhella massiliensis TaxID=1903261 RepID=UPI00097D0819|nr:hypothetical protein [Mailhella massiliensis]